MANVEGPLSKWTNVMKGWQYRWFVLDELSGLLSYYTSKDKMMRGARRGCVRLKGAVIGIDDEDDSTFTITVDQKTFHFQARDADEREKWIIALENTILRHSESCKKFDNQTLPSIFDFERKLAETDVYLQILIDQVKSLEERIDSCGDIAAKEKYNVIKVTAEAMIESIKHTIVMLQISKESLRGPVVNSTLYDLLPMPLSRVKVHSSDPSALMAADVPTTNGIETATEAEQLESDDISISQSIATIKLNTDAISSNAAGPLSVNSSLSVHDESSAAVSTAVPGHVPETSYSSSEDEDFFDAEEYRHLSPKSSPDKSSTETTPMETPPGDDGVLIAPPIITSDDDYFDELYDDKDSEGLESLEKHGSIVTHLLSQVRIGMDLTKVVLPTFILERRSLLEMYADFFAHPDLFVRIADLENNQDRMVQVVRWYLSAFHAGRNSEIAKKPYNPILGETFLCHWKVPGLPKTNLTVDDGPLPWITQDNLAFISEQVSHHPPISAFYAEHYGRRISLNGYIWTKSKFLGLSIGVHMIGQAVLSVIDYDEEYIFTFPNGYGRSILTIPWVELGGKVALTCPKTGYSANIEFHTKPFYGGKKHRLTADILAPNEKKPFCTIEGEWNGVMYAKYASGMNEIFVDTKRTPIVKKQVQAIENQTEFESRSLWKDVTYNLKHKYIDEATDAKHKLEQRQRDEAKERKEKGLKWETKFFQEVGEHWVYENALLKRLGASASASASSSTSQEQT